MAEMREQIRIMHEEVSILRERFSKLEQENQRLIDENQTMVNERVQFNGMIQQLQSELAAAKASTGKASGPKVSLPAKFDGTRSLFRGFMNQIRLVLQMKPYYYPTETTKVGLVGTLLTGMALAWFAPLIEKNSPLLQNFDDFVKEFQACFGDTDSERTAITKIRRLVQGNRPASTYAAEFRLLACDISWGEPALIDQFRHGLRNDVKDLLLHFDEEPKSLAEAVSRAVRCDNRLFERRTERMMNPAPRNYAGVVATPNGTPALGFHQAQVPMAPVPQATTEAVPMEIEATRRRGPLSEAEKTRR